MERVIVKLGVGEVWEPRIQQTDQRPRDPALGLPALTEEDDVLAGQDGVLQLRKNRLVVAQDSRQEGLIRPNRGEEIGAHLLLDAPRAIARGTQLSEGGVGRSITVRRHAPSVPPG